MLYVFLSITIISALLFIGVKTFKDNSTYSLLSRNLANFCVVVLAILSIFQASEKLMNYQVVIVVALLGLFFADTLSEQRELISSKQKNLARNGQFILTFISLALLYIGISVVSSIVEMQILYPSLIAVGVSSFVTIALIFVAKWRGLDYEKFTAHVVLGLLLSTFLFVFTLYVSITTGVAVLFTIGTGLMWLAIISWGIMIFGKKQHGALTAITFLLHYAAQICIAMSLLSM